MSYTIYAYFNSEQIRGVLNAVVMLIGSGVSGQNYLGLLRVCAMLGIFIAFGYGFLRARGDEAGHYLLMVAIFYSTLFVPRVTVYIEEHGAGTGPVYVVGNVPVGLAFFASTTSHIGHWLTESTETFFALPDTAFKLSQNGLMGGARALRVSSSAAITNPMLLNDMTAFMRDCVNPELALAPGIIAQLMQSTTIWADFSALGLINPGRMVALSSNPFAVTCLVGYNTLSAGLNAQIAKEQSRIAQLLNPRASVATANTLFSALLNAQEAAIMSASASTAEAIKQRMMINVLNTNSGTMAQILNDPSGSSVALGQAMAESAANTTYAVTARLAQETLPMIRNAIELVMIGVFPIMILLVIIAGSKGGTVLRSYVMMMMWLQLWAPLYAIINYVGTIAGNKSLTASLGGINGLSISNAASLVQTGISAESVAGMLTVAVPIIALALVKGGEVAMSGVVSSLAGPVSQASGAAGQQVGLGNASMGNLSWGNVSTNNENANSSSKSFRYGSGERGEITGQWGSAVLRGGNGVPEDSRVGGLRIDAGNGIGGQHGKDIGFGNGLRSGLKADNTTGNTAGLDKGLQGGLTEQQSTAQASRITGQIAKAFGFDKAWQEQAMAAYTGGQQDGTTLANTVGHDSSLRQGGDFGFSARGPSTGPGGKAGGTNALTNLPGSGGKWAGLADAVFSGLSAKYGFVASETERQSWSSDTRSTADQGKRAETAYSDVARALDSTQAQDSVGGEKTASRQFMSALADTINARTGTSLSASRGEYADKSTGVTQTNSGGYTVNDTPQYEAGLLRVHGGNWESALKAMTLGDPSVNAAAAGVGLTQAASVAPPQGATAMNGASIAPPRSVDAVYDEGKAAVDKESGANRAAVVKASEQQSAQVSQRRDANGALPPNYQPPTGPGGPVAQEVSDRAGGVVSNMGGITDAMATDAGVRLASGASFKDDHGETRLLASAFLFGDKLGLAKSPEQLQRGFTMLASQDAQAAAIFQKIGNTHRVTNDDMKVLGEKMSAIPFSDYSKE